MAFPGVKSFVNQPTRLFISSEDDTTTPTNGAYNQFTVNYKTAILGCRKAQLLRCTIPNASATGATIPNYMCVFWYYQLPTSTTTPSSTYLKCIRLYPSNPVWSNANGAYTTFSQNRYFSNPGDFVNALNVAASTGGDNATNNPYWVANDIIFSFNSSTNQISMTGLTSGKYYAIAGYNDPNIASAAVNITCPLFSGGTIQQPYVAQQTLNLRVGYSLSGQAVNYQGSIGNTLYANIGNFTYAANTAIPPDSFPDLVYTQCVYLYSNLCLGSSVTSNNRHNLLSVAPITAGQLVISQYVALTINYLLNTPDTIYNITVEMRDDNDQPYYLNDNNTVNIEIALSYVD